MRRSRLALVTLILFGAFVVRAVSLDAQSLWRDEVDALCYAYAFPQAIASAIAPQPDGAAAPPCACPPSPVDVGARQRFDLVPRLVQTLKATIRHNGPLHYVLLRGWIALAGTSVTALRFFSLWFGVLSVALMAALGRRLFGREAGVIAALLAAASPYFVWYSQDAKMYTLVLALVLLAVYALRRAVEGAGARWWAVQIAATTLLLYTHAWGGLLIPVQVGLFLAWWPQARRQVRGGVISLNLLTLPYLPLLTTWPIVQLFTPGDTGFPRHTLGQMFGIVFKGWSTGIWGWGWPWGGIALGTAALLGLAGAVVLPGRRAHRRTAAGLAVWAALPLTAIWFISLWQPRFTDRYLIWSAPALYLLAAAGLSLLWEKGRAAAGMLLVALVVAFLGNVLYQATTPIKSDFRAAADIVSEQYAPGDVIVFQIPHGRYTFDYYYPHADYAWIEGLYTNHTAPDGSYLLSQQQAGAYVNEAVRPYGRVWLVATEVDMWDRRHLVQAWLDAHGTPVLRQTVALIEVTLYDLP
ncbi:MAG: glycosyltransferase family 39 protein [Anaerolineae bacterium]|nr:glycosyltransferase family 39 protein [Anaerolineae bacterium]